MKRWHVFNVAMMITMLALSLMPALSVAQGSGPQGPVVRYATRSDVSPPLRSIEPISPQFEQADREIPRLPLPRPGGLKSRETQRRSADPSLQTGPGATLFLSPIQNLDGLDNDDNRDIIGLGVIPPDTQGDVGPSHYVQWVNLVFAIWDKSGNLLYGPAAGNSLWRNFGGPCEITNHGDPITLYDPLADRWMMSQFALPTWPYGPFYQCIAVSATGDPTGSWYRYEFEWENGYGRDVMNDYPKFGVWPDGYYMTANQFEDASLAWAGTGAAVFERDRMLNGQPARMVYFDLGPSDWGGVLPSDLDGSTPPPAGAPNPFVQANADEWDVGLYDALLVYEFHVDWATPANSTFVHVATLPTAPFDGDMCGFSRECISQPDTTQRLDAIADRLMHRLQYRNFGGYETLVTNLTVDADGTDHAGVRWFELRKAGGAWSIYQQGTYSPDSDHRWMGSVAMDRVGNIGLGYSVSSSSTYPSIRYAGRLAGDPPGTLPQAETELVAGSGFQADSSRWGDYSMMAVDPVDDCTFWYTQQYISAPSAWGNWKTRIGTFRFPGCVGPTGVLEGVVEEGTGAPVAGARVTAESSPTFVTHSRPPDGSYSFATITTGSYTMTTEAYGYQPQTVTSVDVFSGTTTVQDFGLTPVTTHIVSGTITDAATGWPLYASVDIYGYPGDAIWSDPVTGFYSIALAEGITYTFQVDAWSDGYHAASRTVGPLTGDRTESFDLDADLDACTAPGYGYDVSVVYETFEAKTTPPGWTVIDNASTGAVWRFDNPGRCSNNTGGSDNFAIVDSDYEGPVDMDTELRTPVMDLSGMASVTLNFKYDFFWYSLGGDEVADVDVSADGGSTWSNVWTRSQGSDRGPETAVIDLTDIAAGQSDVMVRFHYYHANYDWWWQVDDVFIGSQPCTAESGGLVVGNVYDGNTTEPLVGATVTNDRDESVTATATPRDAAVNDAFHTIFSPAGSHTFTAMMHGGYGPDVETTLVMQSDAVWQDFYLPAGRLSYLPDDLRVTLDMGTSATLPFTLTNGGGLAATYELIELDEGVSPLGPFETPVYGVKSFKQNLLTAERLALPEPPPAPSYAAGDVVQTWPIGLAYAWGLGFNTTAQDLWLGNIGVAGGDDRDHRFLTDGTHTGDTIDVYPWVGAFAADMTYHSGSGMLWQMNVGGDNCIHELDPVNLVSTGNTICPAWSDSQRGLAYDPTTDTFFAGSWNDQMIHHFASDGTMLDQINVGLSIAGLAYNPDTQHLFVMINDVPNPVYVLDAANNYAAVGQFTVPGFDDYDGAGLEIDCDGNLWAVAQLHQTVYQFESGETTTMCTFDVPWLSEDPITGTVASLTSQPIAIAFDAGVAEVTQPGSYHAQLKIRHDTPYNVTNVPVTMTIVAPPDWGKLRGTVAGLGSCDASPAPVEGADVVVESRTGMTWTLTTDENGEYSLWLAETGSPFTVTVSAAEHETATTTDVTVSGSMTVTVDFYLRWLQPCVRVEPGALDLTLSPGQSATLPLTLTNDGAMATSFDIREQEGGYAAASLPLESLPQTGGQVRTVAETKETAPAQPADAHVPSTSGGPDGFGYVFKDSDEPGGPAYEWIEIAPPAGGSGTAVGLAGVDDGYFWPLDLPFPFNFYGTDYTRLAIGSNGTVYFEDDYLGLLNTGIPSANSYGVHTFIAHFWDDLVIHPGEVYYWHDDNRFIVEYYQVGGFASSSYGTWELILSNDGNILFQYQDPTVGGSRDYGAQATVGIQGDTNTGLEYAYNTPALSAQLAICFAYPGNSPDCVPGEDVPWLSEEPITGTVSADSAVVVDVTLTALPALPIGVHTATLVVHTDDPVNGRINVPVTMTIDSLYQLPPIYLPIICHNAP